MATFKEGMATLEGQSGPTLVGKEWSHSTFEEEMATKLYSRKVWPVGRNGPILGRNGHVIRKVCEGISSLEEGMATLEGRKGHIRRKEWSH
ncbi:hypothetical protein CEXT_771611 [Caerostris extrusa]|uniref:Uncharacterized protein n=1 Tax=Caerostris extrusa TaxID=172846 RepID=A0AAV4VN91_CAEEX|nr:hypothetical protein CEXT_771611 [Caerostris extrusa]